MIDLVVLLLVLATVAVLVAAAGALALGALLFIGLLMVGHYAVLLYEWVQQRKAENSNPSA